MDTITLTDKDGNRCYFNEAELIEQLAFCGLPPSGSAALKSVVRNFATLVREMRRAQQHYYSVPPNSDSKPQALASAKRAESDVDKVLKVIFQTVERV